MVRRSRGPGEVLLSALDDSNDRQFRDGFRISAGVPEEGSARAVGPVVTLDNTGPGRSIVSCSALESKSSFVAEYVLLVLERGSWSFG